ncbi:MAG: SRPBCC domain-containing protein [Stappiaceae bacterium]
MSTTTTFEDGKLHVRRTFDEPRTAVFDAWIQASKTKEWWGCADTVHVTSEIEPKVGGNYIHAMTIKNVGVHPIKGQITAFEPPARLAYKMPGMSEGDWMQVNVEFIEDGGTTNVHLTQWPIPDPLRDIIAAGWTASFERMARFFAGERRAA